jgi:hypothetical protein
LARRAGPRDRAEEHAMKEGVAEQAGEFRRAFKKWTGRTASSYLQCRR